jgi:hypothetical protein
MRVERFFFLRVRVERTYDAIGGEAVVHVFFLFLFSRRKKWTNEEVNLVIGRLGVVSREMRVENFFFFFFRVRGFPLFSFLPSPSISPSLSLPSWYIIIFSLFKYNTGRKLIMIIVPNFCPQNLSPRVDHDYVGQNLLYYLQLNKYSFRTIIKYFSTVGFVWQIKE